jgi:hypothetical protein
MKFPICAVSCLGFSLSSPAFAACSLTKVTEMPLVELGAHYAVMVKINDVMRPMIVDTGAEVTVLKLSAANDLKLTLDASNANLKPMVGIGQTSADVYPNVIPSVLAFGDLAYNDRSTAVAKIDDGKTPENDSIGLLGDDILSQYEVEFDFPSKKLTFYSAFGCYGTFAPWSGAYSTIPFDHRGAKVAIDVFLNDERTPTIVDTGNNGSFVSRSASALFGVSEEEFAKTKALARSPLNDGTSFPISTYKFDRLRVGDEVLSQRNMGVVDVDFPFGSANFGLDYWRTRKIWFSYRNNWMFVANNPSTAMLAYPVKEAAPMAAEATIGHTPEKKEALAKAALPDASAPDGQ